MRGRGCARQGSGARVQPPLPAHEDPWTALRPPAPSPPHDLDPDLGSGPERHLALGVLAHVDAGKTSLTEALLVAGGVLDHVGRVDDGTTQTDTLALERRRGITIRTAVASFRADGVVVDLVDTPGHPDFIAEVDRSLAVLDGAVLVVSAVEGVQAQTVVLHRALRRLRVPTVLFVNKVDRRGADPDRVVVDLRERLGLTLVALGTVHDPGRPSARVLDRRWDDVTVAEEVAATLAEHDDDLLRTWVEQGTPDARTLRDALGRLTRAGRVHPLLLGSARTGAGVPALVAAATDLLTPPDPPDARRPADVQVFKVEHDKHGARVCTVRVRGGTLAVRDRVRLGPGRTGVVTALRAFEPGGTVVRDRVGPGVVAQVAGLGAARVGDRLAAAAADDPGHDHDDDHGAASTPTFPPPALRTTVVARDPRERDRLRRALVELADVDPLIHLRADPLPGALRIDVYGEVQREVIAETLALEHGLLADFTPPVAACVERPAAQGWAVRRMGEEGHHRQVTVGVTVSPAAPGSGSDVAVAAERLTLPLHVYGTVEGLRTALLDHLAGALEEGPRGWPVTDVLVTLAESDYPSGGPSAADVRLTFVEVVREALVHAGTVVCEPVDRFRLEVPTASVTAAGSLLARHRGRLGGTHVDGPTTVLTGLVPTIEVDAVRRGLPTAAHGLAVLESAFDHHAPSAAQRKPR